MLADPIVALATPAGRSALAVVRLSGRGAFEVAARVIEGFDPARTRRATLARFVDGAGEEIDRGIWTAYPGPASYTGDDVVELTAHGGLLTPARLVAALQAAGARAALPGEFTRRAVLNGKLDLIQAEAVGDLIDATAPAQARAALGQLDGALSRRIAELRDGVIELQALIAYDIDFPEEDDGPVPRTRILSALEDLRRRVERLLASAPAGERLREGATVVIAGRPNAGKSSLFNALLGAERAIVTEVAGTTRDAIEVATSFGGWPVRLVDTAGLREAEDRLERLGVEVSRRWLDAAGIVLLCVPAGSEVGADESALRDDPRTLLIRTKLDLMQQRGGDYPVFGGEPGIGVSTLTAQGLDAVASAIAQRAAIAAGAQEGASLEPMLTRERHRVALTRAAESLAAAAPHLADAGDPVLAGHHIRQASDALDALIGTVDVEQVLDRLFGSFCIGK